jgi:hypothetical protein
VLALIFFLDFTKKNSFRKKNAGGVCVGVPLGHEADALLSESIDCV